MGIVLHLLLPLAAPASSTSLRVATYNIDCRVCDLSHEHGSSFKERTERERAVLSEINADVIFIEEPVLAKDARMLLPTNRAWTVLQENRTHIFPLSFPDPDATLAVDADRFAVDDWGWLWLGPEPSRPGGFDIFNLPRIAVWGSLRDRRTNASFVAMATHFDHGDGTGKSTGPSTTECVQSAREIASQLANNSKLSGRPLLFGGDLNSHNTSHAYQILLAETNLADTWFATDRHTIYRNDSSAAAAYKLTIDHILATPHFEVHGAGSSVRAWETGKGAKAHAVPPSDHFPVWADVELKLS